MALLTIEMEIAKYCPHCLENINLFFLNSPVDKCLIPSMRTWKIWFDFISWDDCGEQNSISLFSARLRHIYNIFLPLYKQKMKRNSTRNQLQGVYHLKGSQSTIRMGKSGWTKHEVSSFSKQIYLKYFKLKMCQTQIQNKILKKVSESFLIVS